MMRLPRDRQLGRLPKSFPVGTVYVVEGRGGEHGHLCVSSRYLVLPSGRQIDVPADLGRAASARALGRRRTHGQSQAGNQAQSRPVRGAKKFAAQTKKIFVDGGTSRQGPR
jgi:hypothetical protein